MEKPNKTKHILRKTKEDQEYGRITKVMSKKARVNCFDGQLRTCDVREIQPKVVQFDVICNIRAIMYLLDGVS